MRPPRGDNAGESGWGQKPSGKGRGAGGGSGKGPGGDCVCPACGERVKHERRKPCFEMRCPKCGGNLTRG